jgi:predicted O-methyltransferase YrrM
MTYPPGHFYSPIPSLQEIREKEASLFPKNPGKVAAVDFNDEGQIDLVKKLDSYCVDFPYVSKREINSRYRPNNPAISEYDARMLFCLIRHLRPRRVVEVGIGYSSCVILDANEVFFENSISCTFIDPYPDLLLSLMKEGDRDRVQIIRDKVQDVSLDVFASLSAGDLLLIDSSHVSKIGSDVNHIFFQVLPSLNRGVYINLHDVFYPFEYPKEWIYKGLCWNEDYLLRAFLEYNHAFQIQVFPNYLAHVHRDKVPPEFLWAGNICLLNV